MRLMIMKNDIWITASNFFDNINEWAGKIFSWLVVVLTVVMVIDVFMRNIGFPTAWGFETVKFLFGAHFMLVAGYGLLYGSHVRIDLLTDRMSKMTESIISLICYLILFLPFVVIWFYYGWGYFYTSWSIGEKSWSTWGPPLYPIKYVIPIAALFLIIQGISEIMKIVVTIRILFISARGVSK
jgi:TRAP-type mannitol/chloroaromatic compound transport system permease small subunit